MAQSIYLNDISSWFNNIKGYRYSTQNVASQCQIIVKNSSGRLVNLYVKMQKSNMHILAIRCLFHCIEDLLSCQQSYSSRAKKTTCNWGTQARSGLRSVSRGAWSTCRWCRVVLHSAERKPGANLVLVMRRCCSEAQQWKHTSNQFPIVFYYAVL